MNSNDFGIESVFSQAEELLACRIPLDVMDVRTGGLPQPRTDKETLRVLLDVYDDSDLVMVLGGEDGLVALEVVPDSDGYQSLRRLMDKMDLPVNTPILNSGNGYAYILYRFPGTPSNSRVKLGPGLALAANGQFIVVPPKDRTQPTQGWWKNFPTDPNQVAPVPSSLAALL